MEQNTIQPIQDNFLQRKGKWKKKPFFQLNFPIPRTLGRELRKCAVRSSICVTMGSIDGCSLAFFCCLFLLRVSYCRKYFRLFFFVACSKLFSAAAPLVLFVPLVLQEANKYFSWEIKCNKLYRIEIKMKILLYMFFHFAARMEEKLKYKNEKSRGGFVFKYYFNCNCFGAFKLVSLDELML